MAAIPQNPSQRAGEQSAWQRRYWSKVAAERDFIPSLIRNRPVPAMDLPNTKHISAALKLELTVEQLAMLDEFVPSTRIDNADFYHMDTNEQRNKLKKLTDEVRNAPDRQQESAKQNLVDQLGVAGKWLGRNSWAASKTIGDAVTPDWLIPGAKKVGMGVARVVNWSGEEVTAEWIYHIQDKLLAGNQKFERRVRAYRDMKYGGEDLPWWRSLPMLQGMQGATKGFGTGEFKEAGFDVPIWVHLPMEVFLDPLNLVPIGAAFKAARAFSLVNTANTKGYAQAASRLTQAAAKQSPTKYPSMAEFMAEQSAHQHAINNLTIRQAHYDSGLSGSPWLQRIGEDGQISYYKEADGKEVPFVGGGAGRTGRTGKMEGEVPHTDSEELPLFRGLPENVDDEISQGLRGQYSALREVAEDPELLAGDLAINSWVMQAMYHWGLRSNELQHIKYGDLLDQVSDVFLNPVVPMDIGGKRNDRLMFRGQRGDAYDFTKRFLEARKNMVGGTTKDSDPAFWAVVKDSKGVYGRAAADATNINIIFKEAAERYGSKGEKLLDYYRREPGTRLGNNNFAYVFRYAFGARTFGAGGAAGNRSALDVSLGLGHSSIKNTAIYLSQLQLAEGSLRDAMSMWGFTGIEEALEKTPGLLNPFPTGRNLIDHPNVTELVQNTKGEWVRARVTPQRAAQIINNEREKFILANVQPNPTLQTHLPDGMMPKAAEIWGKLESLSAYMEYLNSLRLDKTLLSGRSKWIDPDVRKEAQLAQRSIDSWMFAHAYAGKELLQQLKETGDEKISDSLLSLLMKPFISEELRIISRGESSARFAGMGRGAGHPTLADLLPADAIKAAERTEPSKTLGRTVDNPQGGALRQTLAHRVARLTQDEVDTANKELVETNTATIGGRAYTREELAKAKLLTEPGDELIEAGLLHAKDPRFTDATTKDLPLQAGYVLKRTYNIEDPVSGVMKSDERVYIHTEWIYHPVTKDLTHARVERLATDHLRDGLVVLARDPAQELIPISEFHRWANTLTIPIPLNPASGMFGELGRSGPKTLTALEVAKMLYNVGRNSVEPTAEMDIRAWRAALSPVASDADAIARGLDGLPHVPAADRITGRGTSRAVAQMTDETTGLSVLGNDLVIARDSGGKRLYQWSKQVLDELARLVEKDEAGYGWASHHVEGKGNVLGRSGVPGQPPGASPPAGGFPEDYNFMEFGPRGESYGLEQVMAVPLSMDHPIQFTGTGLAARFFQVGMDKGIGPSFPLIGKIRAPRGSQKYLRMLVPGTFGTSEPGKLTATYRLASEQGKQIASEIAFRLQQTFSEAGLLEDDMLGRVLQLRRRSQVKQNGQLLNPDDEHPLNRLRNALFSEFKSRSDTIWTDDLISRDISKWTWDDNLRFVESFLRTERADLNKWYVMDGPNGQALQKAYDYYHQVGPQLMKMFEAAGFDPSIIMKNAAGEDIPWETNFVPALTTSKWSEDADFGIPGVSQAVRRIGDAPTTFSDRFYANSIEGKMRQGYFEGATNHNVYEHDPIMAITRQVEQYYQYIIDQQFMDKFLELGVDKTVLLQPVSVGRKIFNWRYAYEFPRRVPLTEAEQAKAAKYYGKDWATMPMEQLQRKQAEFKEISRASREVHLQAGLEYFVDSKRIKETVSISPEASRELMALGSDLIDPLNGFVRHTSAVANTMRVLATGADFGVMLLHGFGAFGTMLSPTGFLPDLPALLKEGQYKMSLPWKARQAWGLSTYNMMRAIIQPKVRRQWYINTSLERADMAKYGISFFRSTFTEDLPTPGVFTTKRDYPGKKQLAKPMEHARDIVKRPVEGFGFFLDVSKTEMWRAWRSAGMAENDLQDLAASLNAIHGTINPNVAGMQHKQRVFESAFFLYAALYRRSALALLKNATSGIVPGGVKKPWRRGPALHALSGMAAAGAALAYGIKEMGFNDDVFDMDSPDFMAMKSGKMRIGIGTPFYTYIRMGTDAFQQMIGTEDSPRDLKGLMEFDIRENKVLRWLRSQTSPTTAAVSDILNGNTFSGDPLRDTTGGWEVEKIGTRLSRTLIPFWLESLIDEETRSLRGSTAELFGLRVSPQSPYGRLLAAKNMLLKYDTHPDIVSWRNKQERLGLPVNAQSAPILLIRNLVDRHPDLQLLEEEMAVDTERRGTTERKAQDQFIREIEENRSGTLNEATGRYEGGADQMLLGWSVKFENGEIDGHEFQKQVMLIETWLRGANEQVAGTHAEVIKRFDERREGRLENKADMFYMDMMYDLYRRDITNSPDLHDVYGNFDVQTYVRLKNSFRNKYGEEVWQYIQDMSKQGRNLPGAVKRLYEARETLQDYWTLHDRIWGPDSAEVQLVNHWRSLKTEEGKQTFALRYSLINDLLWTLDYEQKEMRRQQPKIDALLVEFYDYSPLTASGSRISQQRQISGIRNVQTITERLEALSK